MGEIYIDIIKGKIQAPVDHMEDEEDFTQLFGNLSLDEQQLLLYNLKTVKSVKTVSHYCKGIT